MRRRFRRQERLSERRMKRFYMIFNKFGRRGRKLGSLQFIMVDGRMTAVGTAVVGGTAEIAYLKFQAVEGLQINLGLSCAYATAQADKWASVAAESGEWDSTIDAIFLEALRAVFKGCTMSKQLYEETLKDRDLEAGIYDSKEARDLRNLYLRRIDEVSAEIKEIESVYHQAIEKRDDAEMIFKLQDAFIRDRTGD